MEGSRTNECVGLNDRTVKYGALISIRERTMVKIEDGGPAQTVPMVYYDEDGERHVVGNARVQLVLGQLQAVGSYTNIPGCTGVGAVNLESFSVTPFRGEN